MFWEAIVTKSPKNFSATAKPLDIMIFADETVTSMWHGTECHPIVATLGNLPIWLQAKDCAKLVVGYIPKITGMFSYLFVGCQ